MPKSKTRNIHDHPWIDKELLSLIKRKNKQRLKANRTGCVHDAQKFKDLRRLTKQLISQKEKEYATKLRDSATENPKRFWSFVKSSRSVKITANFLRDNQSFITDSPDKANLLNSFFHSVFSPAQATTTTSNLPLSSDTALSNIQLTENEVFKALDGLDSSKACGPDGIPGKLPKMTANIIAPSLCQIYNHSLSQGVVPADKGRMTVIMNKSDYIDKANTLLKDTETYQPLDTDPSKTTVNRINMKLKQLKDKDKLEETNYKRIRPNDASTAKFHGLPKIHKENIPPRPIVSLPGSPTYELSKYLAMILHPLVKTSPHTINNANTFLTNIKDLKLEPDEIMISFDVVSLFTSIPLDTAKRITNELLTYDESWQTRTKLDKHDILELLDLCLSTEFSFQNSYYRQISGTPMGSPLSSFLAEAVMQDLEKRSVTNNNDIKTWNRYVDDVLATVKKDKTDEYKITENIKFTKEEEDNNQLAFLDILLTRNDDGTINTQVYRKKTHTDQILNFNSNHPTQHKISCIRSLFNRIDTHCKTEQAKQTERKYLYSTFMKNNYPRNFVNKILTKIRNKQQSV